MSKAERLYVIQGMKPAEVCAALKKIYGAGAPSQKTIERWCKNYGWRIKRERHRSSPQGAADKLAAALPNFAARLEDLMSRADWEPEDLNKAARLVDAISKVTKSVQAIRREIDFRQAVLMVMHPFADHVTEKVPEGPVRDAIIDCIQSFSLKAENM